MGDERRRRIHAAIVEWDRDRGGGQLTPRGSRELAAAIDAALTRPSADERLMAKALSTLRPPAEFPW